jgi:hypothetical protein
LTRQCNKDDAYEKDMLKHPQIDLHITMYFVSELQEFEKNLKIWLGLYKVWGLLL